MGNGITERYRTRSNGIETLREGLYGVLDHSGTLSLILSNLGNNTKVLNK